MVAVLEFGELGFKMITEMNMMLMFMMNIMIIIMLKMLMMVIVAPMIYLRLRHILQTTSLDDVVHDGDDYKWQWG